MFVGVCGCLCLRQQTDKGSRAKASVFSCHAGVLDQNVLIVAPRLAQKIFVNHTASQRTQAL